MLGWLRGKLTQGIDAKQRSVFKAALASHFEPLDSAKVGIPGIAARLAGYVLDGSDQGAVKDLVARTNTSSYSVYVGGEKRFSKTLGGLVKLLPEDAEIYSRLATVYDAASRNAFSIRYSPIPGLRGSHRWLCAFLEELAGAFPEQSSWFPVSLVEGMIAARDEDAAILVRGALLVQDQQGKSQLNRWTKAPYMYFRCLSGFPERVADTPEAVREAFAQSNADARAYALLALATLEVPIAGFVEEIAALAVSGSKEVRERALPLVQASYPLFQPLLEKSATTGSSEVRFNAVRLLGRTGGEGARAFLRQRLETERAQKVAEAIGECLREDQGAGGAGGRAAGEEFVLEPVAEVPARASLDRQVLADLRVCLDEFERRAADEFAKNKFAQKQKAKRNPPDPDAADKLFEALQEFVDGDEKTWAFVDRTYGWMAFNQLMRFAAHRGFALVHLVRWCLLVPGRTERSQRGNRRQNIINYQWREAFLSYRKARKEPIDLRELAAAFKAVG